jgi:hypothetical protein
MIVPKIRIFAAAALRLACAPLGLLAKNFITVGGGKDPLGDQFSCISIVPNCRHLHVDGGFY